jgi:hypothetical protein
MIENFFISNYLWPYLFLKNITQVITNINFFFHLSGFTR